MAQVRTFERTAAGLRDAIMSEMEDIRSGIATPAEAQACALLAGRVIDSFEQGAAEKERADNHSWREREAVRRKEENDRKHDLRLKMLENPDIVSRVRLPQIEQYAPQYDDGDDD